MVTKDLPDFKILEIVSIKRENMQFKTESKDCYVLSCRIYGESTFFYNGNTRKVCTGDVLYVPHGSAYRQACQEEEIIAIHLDITGNAPGDICIHTPEDPAQMCRLFQSLYGHWQQKGPGAIYHCMSDLYKIVAMTNIFDSGTASNPYGIITPSVRYLQANLYAPGLSLDAVYRQSTLSQTSFIKHFRKHFGCTPLKYISKLRIQKAQLLLCSGLYTREEIASLCGFENVKHFYVVFKKIAGCTTGEYLKNAINVIQ